MPLTVDSTADPVPERPIRLEASWREALAPIFKQPFMTELRDFLQAERQAGKTILPRPSNWFRALDLTPLPDVRVVILGQDPYHGPGQAHGLCFSVQPGVAIPPSLQNIYKELHDDLGIAPAPHGFLESWAEQGVLLLNTVLTVEARKPASHAGRGWEKFTDAVIQQLVARDRPCVFLLWGRHAQNKAGHVEGSGHLVLKAPHPSPFSARNGFFGCRHFSRANDFLRAQGLPEINWQLPASV